MSIQRWKDMWYGEDHGELLPREDGEYVLYADHVAEVSQVRLDAVCDQMDHDSRCIADGHRGNGTYERDYYCQVCQEIMCDDDCPVSVARDRVEAMRAACIAAVENVPYITNERWADTAPITVAEYRRHVLQTLEKAQP